MSGSVLVCGNGLAAAAITGTAAWRLCPGEGSHRGAGEPGAENHGDRTGQAVACPAEHEHGDDHDNEDDNPGPHHRLGPGDEVNVKLHAISFRETL
jgi:hypothetical protein